MGGKMDILNLVNKLEELFSQGNIPARRSSARLLSRSKQPMTFFSLAAGSQPEAYSIRPTATGSRRLLTCFLPKASKV